MHNDTDSPFFTVLFALFVALAAILGVFWGGAALAAFVTAHEVGFGLPAAAEAIKLLPDNVGDPRLAWPEPIRSRLPGATLYWACTAVVVVTASLASVIGLRLWLKRWRFGPEPRNRFGLNSHHRLANKRDLSPLRVPGPVSGRLILGRAAGCLLATENRIHAANGDDPKPTRVRSSRPHPRAGDRGAVALMGPSRCGKTTAAISGILHWDGPAILSSVKNDLLEHTVACRSALGDVKVFAPTRDGSASWSPLRAAASLSGARAAAHALCDAAPKDGVDGADFWYTQVEVLLSALMWVAANTPGATMAEVCDWVATQDRRTEKGDGTVATLLTRLDQSQEPATRDGARRARAALEGIWDNDERIRGSVYVTAMAAVWPWLDPVVEQSAKGNEITLDWLTAGPNTLYLCGPLQDQRRYAPVFGGLVADLVQSVYERADRTGRALDRPVLLVLDEAANTPLRQLPEWASTCAGYGIQMVTVWQSKAQLDAIYGHDRADTILTNHLTKIGFSGLSDRSSLDYFSYLVGDEHVMTRSVSRDDRGIGGSRSMSETSAPTPIGPPYLLREMKPGDGVLVHGSLPPAHIETLNFRKDKELRALQRGAER